MMSLTHHNIKRVVLNSKALIQKPTLQNQVRYFSANRFILQAEKKNEGEEAKKTEEEVKEEAKEKTPEQLELEESKNKIEKLNSEVKKFKDLYIRSVADFRNLQETTKKDVSKAKLFGAQKLSKDLIETIDNFGHCMKSFENKALSEELNTLKEGVEMTSNVFKKTLYKHGIEELNPVGDKFDPNIHEALFEMPDPSKEAGTVFHVEQLGYTLNGRVIRPAKVGVVKIDQ
ncbi:GrpE protein-like protein, mitochondrial [Hanseniaspora uvarum DSM 2768]|nr:GrpE protein-like protein, mitochondrial [Hanseniaspora uvarum DSM 2768]